MAKDSQRGSSADDERELPDEPTNDDEVDASDDDLVDDEIEDDESDDDESDDDDDESDESDDDDLVDDEADDDDDTEVAAAAARRGKQPKSSGTATKKKPTRNQKSARAAKSPIAGAAPGTFLQQVVNELSKVVWPTRKQMITYTSVVLVFVVLLVTTVWGFDLGVGKVMDWIFA